MNKTIITLSAVVLLAFGSTTFTSCGNAEQTNNEESHEQHGEGGDDHHHATAYKCPMKCEGEKTYAEAGKCPKCEMDLEKADESEHNHDGHEH